MRFVWFWTFWYWCRESFRSGVMLRGPLLGIAGHWDEWYRHEASEDDREAIRAAGASEAGQREFVAWLCRHWARESGAREYRLAPRFVLRQLAPLPPFDAWRTLEGYRAGYAQPGVRAVVLAEGSRGEAGDVRALEAVALPVDVGSDAAPVVAEGFDADAAGLETARRAAMSALCGRGFAAFVVSWVVAGRRPYPRWLGATLTLAWGAVASVVLFLLVGPDPGAALPALGLALVCLWGALVATSTSVAGMQALRAWIQGRRLGARLAVSQIRLFMDLGLTLEGSSAGLAFCLNTLAALHRAAPRTASAAWLWRTVFSRIRSGARSCAATGVVTADARIRPVQLEAKLRACLESSGIRALLTPRQAGAGRRAVARLADSLARSSGGQPPRETPDQTPAHTPAARAPRFGFAAEGRRLCTHRCAHVGQALLALGRLRSAAQLPMNIFAAAASLVVVAALPDLRCILLPPPPPAVVAPSSPSPYHLWVSLDTPHPDRFGVVLESGFWSNRRAEVTLQGGATPSARAEIRLHRPARQMTQDEEEGTVWIERRRWFLTREFAPGERVGRYFLSYVSRLGHE